MMVIPRRLFLGESLIVTRHLCRADKTSFVCKKVAQNVVITADVFKWAGQLQNTCSSVFALEGQNVRYRLYGMADKAW